MAFTYDIESDDATELIISKVRLEISDVVEDQGVRPDGSNFSDAEILLFLEEVDNDVNLAVARACSVLARAWALMGKETVGPRKFEFEKVSENYRLQAESIRSQYDNSVVRFI